MKVIFPTILLLISISVSAQSYTIDKYKIRGRKITVWLSNPTGTAIKIPDLSVRTGPQGSKYLYQKYYQIKDSHLILKITEKVDTALYSIVNRDSETSSAYLVYTDPIIPPGRTLKSSFRIHEKLKINTIELKQYDNK